MRFKRLAWSELPPPGGYGSEAYTALVPAGSLPALKVGAQIIADSEAIAEYLEESVPLPPALLSDTPPHSITHPSPPPTLPR